MATKVQLIDSSSAEGFQSAYACSRDKLMELVDPKNPALLETLGGVDGVAAKLVTNLTTGLLSSDVADLVSRKKVFGENRLPKKREKNIFEFMWEAIQDKTLVILSIVAVISVGVGIYETIIKSKKNPPDNYPYYVEGIAVVIAVLVCVTVASVNDYRKQLQFRKLNERKDDVYVKVMRDGQPTKISVFDIVVGDVILLDQGDLVPTDGLFVSGFQLLCDESALTGESDALKKGPGKDMFMLSGAKVIDGTGAMLVTAVGVHSMNGKTIMSLQQEAEDTPLQVKLGDLAEGIGKIGLSIAGILLALLIMIYFIERAIQIGKGADKLCPGYNSTTNGTSNSTASLKRRVTGSAINACDTPSEIGDTMILFVLQAITIVVVAVPEGLPMAVTMALAYATIRMLKDNNFVRVLAACETMGNATTICSDKTGTLTQNKMSVVRATIGGEAVAQATDIPTLSRRLRISTLRRLCEGINLNSTARETVTEKGEVAFSGSKTEVALLEMSRDLGYLYTDTRAQFKIFAMFPFSSERKRMSTLVDVEGRALLYVKGASEIILGACTHVLRNEGSCERMSGEERITFERLIHSYAQEGYRTLCLAYKDLSREEAAQNWEDVPSPDMSDLTLVGIVGIADPVRPEVPQAVAQCQRSGIVVRMVTGDNAVTARQIAKQCGILTAHGIVLEGPEFRKLSSEQMKELAPKLCVLARSSPNDKMILVKLLKEMGEVVAVTGDGTNDGPALKASDVGFSMGIAGTEVAKEASDIVLLDDNFASIVKAVMWGRTVFDAVRKFLQFQLTVNVTAVTTAFITAVASTDNESVLTPIQLLWVNLIMDSLGALALATEEPTSRVLERMPSKRDEFLLSPSMVKMIVIQSSYQIAILLGLFWGGYSLFGLVPLNSADSGWDPTDPKITLRTIIFNTFVWLQVFGQLNSRRLEELNIFEKIHKHHYFNAIILITAAIQVLIVEFGGRVFRVNGLNWYYWLICLLIGSFTLVIGAIARVLPDWKWPKRKAAGKVEPAAVPGEESSANIALLPKSDPSKALETAPKAKRSGRIADDETDVTAWDEK